MRTVRYLSHILIVGFWIVMMGFLAAREFLPAKISPVEIRFPEKLPYTQDWGIYADTERIGCSRIEFLKMPSGGYLCKGTTEIEWVPVSIETSVLFDSNTRLTDFNIEMRHYPVRSKSPKATAVQPLAGRTSNGAYGLEISIEGKVVGEELRLRYKTADSTAGYTLPWRGRSDIINNGLLPMFYRPGLKAGDRFQWTVFNPLTRRDEPVKAVVRESALYYHKGDFLNALVVVVWYQNAKVEFWIDEDGNPLKISTPWGWVLAAE